MLLLFLIIANFVGQNIDFSLFVIFKNFVIIL